MTFLFTARQAVFEPGLTPPPGITPNPENPSKVVWKINVAVQCICMPVVTTLVLLRLSARKMHKNVGLDDVTCFLGWCGAMAYSTVALLMSQYGAGLHQWDVPKEKVVPYMRLVYGTMVVYGPCAFFIKTSILLFCTRIFSRRQGMRKFIYVFLGLMLCYFAPVLLLKLTICRPLHAFWDKASAPDAHCFNGRAFILCDSVVSIVTDAVILLIPIPLVTSLQMPTKAKIKVGLVFSAGGFATFCGVIRLIEIYNKGTSPDTTYQFTRFNLWGVAEINFGLMCACLPVIPGLFKRCKYLSYSGSRERSQPSHGGVTTSNRNRDNGSPSAGLGRRFTTRPDHQKSYSLRALGRSALEATDSLPSIPSPTARRYSRSRSLAGSVLSKRNVDFKPDSRSENDILLSPMAPAMGPGRLVAQLETSVQGAAPGPCGPQLNGSSSTLEELEEAERGTGIIKTVEVVQTLESID